MRPWLTQLMTTPAVVVASRISCLPLLPPDTSIGLRGYLRTRPPRRIRQKGAVVEVINNSFGGRRGSSDSRLPPGQTLVDDWPVLSTGPTRNVDESRWSFSITTEDKVAYRWNWNELHQVGVEDIVTDIHCVTHWSKLDMAWRGVSLDRLFDHVQTSYDYVMVRSSGGYTTNLRLEDLLGGQAWIATGAQGKPLTPEHGGPARLLVPHLYFWKSAKWVLGMEMMPSDDPGFWERNGYHLRGDPWHEQRYW